jgi:hypothetical protein
MAFNPTVGSQVRTLSFDVFWTWLLQHASCILRAGTPEAILYDDDDFHWSLSDLDAETCLIQLIRGKRPVGELVVMRSSVAFVHELPQDGDEVTFELFGEPEGEQVPVAHFVLNHGYDGEQRSDDDNWIN